MEWYTLDNSLKTAEVIEGFESLSWTERYNRWGDFQIVMKSSPDSRILLKKGTWITQKGSTYIMQVETALDSTEEDGQKKLTVTGRSAEALLEDRVAMPALAGTETTPTWDVTGTPGNIIRYIFTQVCVTGVLSALDTIQFYHSGTLLPAGSIPEPSDTFTIKFDPDTVYNDITKVCDIWALGFRFVKNDEQGQLYFEVYTGNDRTTAQSVNQPVVFDLGMESIDKTSEVASISGMKTVAYVFAANGTAVVDADGADPSASGSDRRAMLVKADDIDLPAGAELTAALTQRGKEELAKFREVYAFDGEIPQHLPYIYGVDYRLGDLVEERSPDGAINYMLVTEHISVSDDQGERSYPTMTLSLTITPGTWQGESISEHWDDVPLSDYWGTI